MIVLTGAVMVYALATRGTLDVNVLHERNPLFVALSDGGVRNDYTVRLLNKRPTARSFTISVLGVPGARIEVVGIDTRGGRSSRASPSGPDTTRELRVLVTVPADATAAELARSSDVTFRINRREPAAAPACERPLRRALERAPG